MREMYREELTVDMEVEGKESISMMDELRNKGGLWRRCGMQSG